MNIRRRWLPVLFTACAAGAAFAVGPAPDRRIGFDGIGGLQVGMREAQVRHAGYDYDIENPYGPTGEAWGKGCNETRLKNHAGLYVMFDDGRVVRASTENPAYRTARGIHVGSTEAAARRAYGASLRVTRHAYDDRGHYLTIKSGKGRVIVMETDGRVVGLIHAGLEGPAQYIEGCL